MSGDNALGLGWEPWQPQDLALAFAANKVSASMSRGVIHQFGVHRGEHATVPVFFYGHIEWPLPAHNLR